MNRNRVSCMNVVGDNLNDDVIIALFYAAQRMFEERKKKSVFTSDACRGELSTEWTVTGIHDVYGYLFTATVEWGIKKSTVTFVTRKANLERLDPNELEVVRRYFTSFSAN